MNEVLQSIRQTVKHGLAIVLFTLLLLGMMGAALGLFSAGITVLTNHRNAALAPPAIPASAPVTASSTGVNASATGETAQSTTQSTTQSGVNPSAPAATASQAPSGVGTSAQSSTAAASAEAGLSTASNGTPAGAGTDLASQLNQQLRHMESPVTAHLDTGGVALGDQVQNAFGHFLSGLLQTLFVEQANSGTSTTTTTTSTTNTR